MGREAKVRILRLAGVRRKRLAEATTDYDQKLLNFQEG
jgi:hypothetical protein